MKFPKDGKTSLEIVISQKIARTLRLSVGDRILMYFFQDPPRFRRVTVAGVYETGLESLDDRLVIGDLAMIQRLNSWPDSLAGGFEVFLNDIDEQDQIHDLLLTDLASDLIVNRVRDKYYEIFSWLEIINKNVFILIVIVLFIACVNMISIVLILIMDRTQMIGILKAVGASDRVVQRVFTYSAFRLVIRGLVWGNLVGVGVCVIQHYFKIIPLDPANYYMSFVPIGWDWGIILFLNALSLVVVGVVMFLPTFIISRVDPIKAIRFN